MKKVLLGLLFAVFAFGGAFFAHQTLAAELVDNTPDCDTVAIVRCGVMTESAVRSSATKGDVSKVYGAFGISSSSSNLSGFVSGIVWKDGRVTMGSNYNQVVATGATTAGRWNNPKPGMTRIAGTDRAYKMPTKYFATEGQTAWLKFDANGKFLFAIIKSCGNPVVAKPVIPKFACESLTAAPINRTTYRLSAKASASNATITAHTYDFGDGQKTSFPTNSTTSYRDHTYAKPGTYTARVSITVKLKTNNATKVVTSTACTVKVTVKEAPKYACDSLTATQTSRNSFRLDGKGSVSNGAKITAHTYDYGDGQKETFPTNSLTSYRNHTYAQPGTYTAKLTLTVSAEGTKTVTGPQCTVKVTVPPAPSYSCDDLDATKITRTQFNFRAAASADNGANITRYHFDFGDGKSSDVATDAKTANASHNYDKAGNYAVRVTVSVLVDGKTVQVSDNKCLVKIHVEELPPVYTCDSLSLEKISRTEFKFNAKANAENGAAITDYTFDFGDGQKAIVDTAAESATASHTYAAAGDYTARVTVKFIVNGAPKEVTGPQCTVKVTVAQQPKYACDALGAELIGEKADRTFKYNLSYSATGGATLRDVEFNFGDNTPAQKFTPAQLGNVTHKYAADGEYTTVATLYFNVNDEVVSDTCEVKVSPQNPPEECKPGIPVGDKRCEECKPGIPEGDDRCYECKPGIPRGDERCTECKPGIPNGDERCTECKPGVPQGSDECGEVLGEETPKELPSTGPEAIIGGLVGTSAISYGAYSYLASRRALRDSMKR